MLKCRIAKLGLAPGLGVVSGILSVDVPLEDSVEVALSILDWGSCFECVDGAWVGCVVSCEESEWFGIGEMFSLDDRREGE